MSESTPAIQYQQATTPAWKRALFATGPVWGLVAVVLLFAALDGYQKRNNAPGRQSQFLTLRNARTVAASNAFILVGALGITIIMIAGGIDLSVGTALGMCSVVLALTLKWNWPPILAVIACLCAGILGGMLNGALISFLRIVPFIVTLGTMTIFLGVAKHLAGESSVRPKVTPLWLTQFTSTQPQALWFGMPLGVWIALVLAAILALVLRYTVFGKHVYAIGSNESTARLCGVQVTRVKIMVYALGGLFAGISGLMLFSAITEGNATEGIGKELRIIAAVVIGGASLSGGRGTVLGTLCGVGIMAAIFSGCTQLGLANPIQDIVLGVVIMAAVTLDQFQQRQL